MRFEFLPAVGPYVVAKGPWNHPTHWYDPTLPFFFPYGLISYALWTKHRDWDWWPEGMVAFGDSGGYSVVTRKEAIDPEAVIRWQMRRCLRGVILDIPPYRPGSTIQFTGSAAQYWDESVDRTTRNVRRCLPIYQECGKDAGFYWWGVVQGESRDQLERWHGAVAGIYPFDQPGEGWALAPKPSTDILSCVRHLRFAFDKGIRAVHFLQVTSQSVLGVILALAYQSKGFDLVTFDSASAIRNAINRGCIKFKADGLDVEYVKETGGRTGVHAVMLRCHCQSCQWYQEDCAEGREVTEAEYPHRILLHNHLIMVESFDRLWAAIVKDPDQVIRFFAPREYGPIMREWDRSVTQPKSQMKKVSLLDRL